MKQRYLAHTPEFISFVERRREEAMRRSPWPFLILLAALDGYLDELLRHMLDAQIYLGHGR